MAKPPLALASRRSARWTLLLIAALAAALPLPAAARPRKPAVAAAPSETALAAVIRAELQGAADAGLLAFYASRFYHPLWVRPDGVADPAAAALLQFVQAAGDDGFDPAAVHAPALATALARLAADRSPAAQAAAEVAVSRSFTAYVRALRQVPSGEMLYEHVTLQPGVPSVADALYEAMRAPSLSGYVGEMRWMNPLYLPLRRALSSGQVADPVQRRQILNTLQRIRGVPAAPGPRYVVVDVASARLWMYENGRAVDSMRVVVGKPDHQTPMMSGYIRYAIVNPYWNVPADLVPNRIAPNVLNRGVSYLKASGYQVLSDWTAEATVIDPKTVDWKAVAKGEVQVRMRQLPSPTNAMGKVKYEFPNKLGIYLHDTPERNLLLKEARQFSSGCIRLEDAERMGRWLMGQPLPMSSDAPEQRVDLPQLVPIYVTYLTAHVEGGQMALGPDPYDRDGLSALAQGAATQPVLH